MSYTQEQLKGMSDLEIDFSISRMLGIRCHVTPGDPRNTTGKWIFDDDQDTFKTLPMYCTDWSVTGPLMVVYKVELYPMENPDEWFAQVKTGLSHLFIRNHNPLRAICEVILMLEEV